MDTPSLFFRTLGESGKKGTLLFLHATGLNASTYVPLLKRVEFPGLVLAPSLRGHGATNLPAEPAGLKSWQTFADDVAEEIEARDVPRPLVMAGHSCGAVTSLLAARRLRPETLLLIEPVVLPEWMVLVAGSPLKRLTVDRIGVARKAAKRRAHFPSREAAMKAYAAKGFFSGWEAEALRGYVDEGFRAGDDGGVELACNPGYEAACFSAQAHGFWPHLEAALGEGIGVRILAASGRSTFDAAGHDRARALGARVDVAEGSHMLPVERPEDAAAWIAEHTGV